MGVGGMSEENSGQVGNLPHGASALEWAHVIALVKRYIATAAGDLELAQVAPSTDRAGIEQSLAEAGEAMVYQRTAIRVNLNGVPNVTAAVQKLRIEGAGLEPREIFDLIAFLDRAADAKSLLAAAAERFPLLGARARGDRRFPQVTARDRRQDSGGWHGARQRQPASAIASGARLRSRSAGFRIRWNGFCAANRNDGVLQEEYVTIRNERFVVPVIAGQRRKLPGVIHGASSTGQTLFLEPLETIDLNNELVRLAGRRIARGVCAFCAS